MITVTIFHGGEPDNGLPVGETGIKIVAPSERAEHGSKYVAFIPRPEENLRLPEIRARYVTAAACSFAEFEGPHPDTDWSAIPETELLAWREQERVLEAEYVAAIDSALQEALADAG